MRQSSGGVSASGDDMHMPCHATRHKAQRAAQPSATGRSRCGGRALVGCPVCRLCAPCSMHGSRSACRCMADCGGAERDGRKLRGHALVRLTGAARAYGYARGEQHDLAGRDCDRLTSHHARTVYGNHATDRPIDLCAEFGHSPPAAASKLRLQGSPFRWSDSLADESPFLPSQSVS